MRIDEATFKAMPPDLQALFVKLPNFGRDEVTALFPQTPPSKATPRNNGEFKSVAKGRDLPHVTYGHDDSGGSAARFFYSAKASRSERDAGLDTTNNHPTVKPVALLLYLVRLITPPNGVVLDPFMGSGTTGIASLLEGFRFIGIEQEASYLEIAQKRIAHHANKQEEQGNRQLTLGDELSD